jgi:F-type H+-transporting ATPase subunit delta
MMMTSQAANYAKVLFSLGLSEESINKSKEILLGNSELVEVLENPSIRKKEKEAVIDDIFEKDIRNFLKVLCLHQQISFISRIFSEYDKLALESRNVIRAKISYITKPEETELEQIKSMLCNKYKKTGVILELFEDPSLIGGYVLTVANTEYDKSIKGTLKEMQKALVRR